jgi:glycogen synthase
MVCRIRSRHAGYHPRLLEEAVAISNALTTGSELRIALISYEMPPESGGGGIGTYISQISRLLVDAGHEVVVFCGSANSEQTVRYGNLKICRIKETSRPRFCETVAPHFRACHSRQPFDVVESPDYCADGVHIRRAYPRIPMIVKLHTPSFLFGYDPDDSIKLLQKMRIVAGALLRLRTPLIPRSEPIMKLEKEALRTADLLASPSQSIGLLVTKRLGLPLEKLRVFPIPYIPSAKLLSVPLDTCTNRITFVGRLEIRKGVIEIGAAIPKVLEVLPNVRFRFIGRDTPAPDGSESMMRYLQQMLGRSRDAVEFWGQVENDTVLSALADTDICMFPSRYDSFGLVCCEAMSAGRGVIGSTSGGMAEILNHGECGLLVPPQNPDALANSMLELLRDPVKRSHMGKLARKRILEHYSADAVLKQQLACYEEAQRVHSVESRT